MSDQRKSGFGVGFSKEVDSILQAGFAGVLYPHEVRRNLEIAGMVLDGDIDLPGFEAPEPIEIAIGLNEEIDEEVEE